MNGEKVCVGASAVVDLIFVTSMNYVIVSSVLRQNASDMIRLWWFKRQAVMHGKGEDEFAPEKCQLWLDKGTMAYNRGIPTETEDTYCQAAVAMEHVVGMYIRERDETITEAQKTAAELMKRQLRDMDKGDNWRGDD